MSAATSLVPVAGLPTCPTDRFRCVPLAATLPASDCLRRQERANGRLKVANTWGYGGGHRAKTDFSMCADCELGRSVAAAVEGR